MKKRFLKFYVLNILIFFLPILLLGQIKEIGTPSIKNYPRKITLAGQQNWMIDQDSSGIMYFANNEGLLEFNGFNWTLNPLPNHSIVRSIKVLQEKVYAGGFNELGYFDRSSTGNLKYHSLLDILPSKFQDFGDIWKIHSVGKDIVFQSFKYIFFYSEKEFTRIIEAPGLFHFSYIVEGELYVKDIQKDYID